MQHARKTTQAARQRRLAREAAAAHRGRRGFGGFRKLFALLLLIPTLMVQAATSTSAGAAVVAGFEIDGNTPDDAGAGVDWGTPTGTHATDPVGNIDTTTFKGSKEFEHPNTWVDGVGLAPNQDDISDVYFHDAIVDGDIWGYVGFRRFTTSGTTNFDVEFNKLSNSSSSSFIPIRSVGDVMVRFEQDGNSAFALTAAWFWTLTSSASWGAGCIEVPGYTPAAGWCAEPVGSVAFTGTTGESGHFAEGAFNFSSLLEQGGIGGATCEGGDFGTMNIRSFTGNANESALKDYVNPVTIDIDDTCGELEVYKVDQFGSAVPGATFSFSPNPIPGQSTSPLVIVDGGAGDPDGAADGDIVIDPATPGTYTVIETAAPPGFELVQPVAARTWTITVGEGGVGSVNTPLTVANRRYFQAPTVLNQPSYDIDYNWLVTKAVADPKSVNVPQGNDASFDYEVRLKALDATTSGFGGTVTVTNPNALDMVATLSAEITGGAGCTVVDAANLDVSPNTGLQVNLDNGANVFTYTCPAATLPGGTTATAAWSQSVYPSSNPAETYTRSDAKAFVIDQKVDESTTVHDTFNGGSAENFGTFNWNTVRAADNHTVVVKTYTRDIAGVPGTCTDYPNKATESADGTEATQSVEVCVGANLDVTKDAHLGFQRELLWDIAKSGPGTVWVGEDEQGDLETSVDFTIDVTADGMSDSEWALTGTIHIDNPNEWPVTVDVTDTVVVDTKNLGCTIDGGSEVVVPANAVDHAVTYDCPGVEQGDYVGKNTVTIDWSKDSHAYPKTNDSDTVDVKVTGDPEPTNATVTLTDLLDGADVTTDLPQSTFDWATVNARPGHTQSMTYSVVLDTEPGACTAYENVVTIDQTQQSADAEAIICSPGVAKDFDADYGRKQLWSIDKVVDKTSVDIAEGGSHTFNYTVTATPGAIVDDGSASWTGTVTVSNPSASESLTVDVTDVPDVEGWTCSFDDDSTQVPIAAGQSAMLDYTCQPAQGAGHPDGTNTAVVSFGDDQSVSEQVDVTFEARAGIADTVVAVHDDKTDPGSPPVKLGEADAKDDSTWEFTYSLVKAGVAGECTTYTNTAVIDLTASADVKDSAQAEVCVEKPVTVAVEGRGTYGVTYPWTIDKVLDEPRTVEVDAATGEATFDYQVVVTAGAKQPAGWTLSGTVTVDNPNTAEIGAITLTDVDVTTDVEGGAACTATLPAAPVASGDDVVIPFECTFTGEPNTSGTVTADVKWDPAGDASSATASGTSDVALTVGDGQEIDKVIQVWDDQTDPEHPVLLDESLEWSDGLVETYEYSLTHEGVPGTCVDFTNTAWLDLSGSQDPEDSTTATMCVEKPLQPDVSGSADLARAYAWSIAKVADATQRTVDGSGTATFTYTVTAKAGAATDSGWRLEGSVKIVNPNAYAAGDIVADVTAATDLGGGSTCTVAGGSDVGIPDSGSVTLPIACTFGSRPSGSGALGVTATWDPAGEATTASVTDSTPVSFAVRSETNKTVQVVDDKTVAGQRVVLDPSLTWASGLVKTYTYSLAVAGGAAGACQSHTNTATIDQPVGTDPTATAVVLACTPAAPPPPEVAPEQSFGKAVGSVKASCQGTVRAKLANRSGETVTYKLRVGQKVHRIAVKSQTSKKFVTKGEARARVTLKVGSTRLDKLRIPALCEAPEVLPDTGLRGTSN